MPLTWHEVHNNFDLRVLPHAPRGDLISSTALRVIDIRNQATLSALGDDILYDGYVCLAMR